LFFKSPLKKAKASEENDIKEREQTSQEKTLWVSSMYFLDIDI